MAINRKTQSLPAPIKSLAQLQGLRLSESEQKVCDYVLANAQRSVGLSIAQLALQSGISQPTVARFCQAAGFSGWREFRLWLAYTMGAGAPYVYADVNAADQPSAILGKVIERSMSALEQLRGELSGIDFNKAVRWLSAARRIEFYGQGNSGITAADGAHKFFRLGITSIAYSDPHLHCVSAAMLGKNDVVIALSNSGKTQAICDSLLFARQAGAKIVALTVPNSPVANAADLVLAINPSEDPDLYAPMTSRIAQLVLIDALAVATALQLGDGVSKRLERYKQVLSTKRIATKRIKS